MLVENRQFEPTRPLFGIPVGGDSAIGILISKAYILPPHLSSVATLPWEVQKSHFQQYY